MHSTIVASAHRVITPRGRKQIRLFLTLLNIVGQVRVRDAGTTGFVKINFCVDTIVKQIQVTEALTF